MKCPVDGETLVMADRSGVEIDYCPKCRGIWLDRGELDKILDRSAPQTSAQPTHREERRDDHGRGDYGRGHSDRDHSDRGYARSDDRAYGKRTREGFLSDLFDF